MAACQRRRLGQLPFRHQPLPAEKFESSANRSDGGIATLLADPERRTQVALAAYHHAFRNFDWRAIGEKQRALLSNRLRTLRTPLVDKGSK
jgi:hypothetical protein